MNIEELKELKRRLEIGEISSEEAGNQLYADSNKKRSWTSKEWKEKREIVLKSACEQCGKTSKTLVAQHTFHPRKRRLVFLEVCNKYGAELQKNYPMESMVADEEVYEIAKKGQTLKDLCPRCFSFNLSKRKTKTPIYSCNHCKNEFDDVVTDLFPVFIDNRTNEVPNNARVNTYTDILYYIYKNKMKNLLFEKHREDINRDTLLILIDEYIRYLSFTDIVTFCNKCAFLWDVKKLKLCDKCKKNYHSLGYSMCQDCNLKQILEEQDDKESSIFNFIE